MVIRSEKNRSSFLTSGRAAVIRPPLWLLALAPCALACGGLRPAPSLAKSDHRWDKLVPGTNVVVFAEGTCAERTAATRAELEQGAGTSLGAAVWAQSAARYQIVESWGEPKEGAGRGGVYLKLSGNGQAPWVRATSAFGCVFPDDERLTAEVLAEKGKSYAFTPWSQSCKEINGAGPGFAATASSLDVPPADVVDSVRLTTDGVRYSLGGGKFVVDRATLATCFAAPGTVKRSEFDYLANLKIEPSRCEVSIFEGKTLVECRSTVGLWNADEKGMSLVRRTLGPLFFLDGQAVSGGRFARTVVAVTTGAAENARQRALYQGIDSAVQQAVAATDAPVRVVPPTDPAVTTRVRLSIGSILIGDLGKRESTETSKYQAAGARVPNPDKIKARSQMQDIERRFSEAKTKCDRQGGSDCRKKLADIDVLMQKARATFAQIPETVEGSAPATWSYKKTTYFRPISATLVIETERPVGGRARTEEKLSFEASDYEVIGDPAHGVSPHAASRSLIMDPDSVLPGLAKKAGEAAAVSLQKTLQQSALDAAIKAFAKAGGSSQAGYELVDAAAYDVAGDRLRSGEAFGEGTGALALPATSQALSEKECLLVAAVAPAPGSSVTITAGRYADARGKSIATLEICKSELGAEAVPPISLGGTAKWAIYKTDGVYAAP
jgi:hypothetical protein